MRLVTLFLFTCCQILNTTLAQQKHLSEGENLNDSNSIVKSAPKSILVNSINESFENTWPPENWTVYSPDGGSGWTTATVGTPIPGWNGGTVTMTPDGTGGQKQAFCTWTTGGAACNDQWLVTPQISISSNYSLSFWIRKYGNYEDAVRIRVSTATNAMEDFTTEIANLEFLATDTGWYAQHHNLSNYNGQNIYIAFNEKVDNTYTDGAAIFIDMVKIDQGSGYENTIINPEIYLYPNPVKDILNILTSLPLLSVQITDLTGQVLLFNHGYNLEKHLNVDYLKPGIYLVNIETQKGTSTHKICISK